MALATLASALPRIIQILNANRAAFAATVADTGAFPFDAEITQAALEADEMVAVNGYFQSVNQSLALAFETESDNLIWGANLPFYRGHYSKVELTKIIKEFLPAAVNTASDRITITAHGFSNGDMVRVSSTGTLPAGLSAGSVYYILVDDQDNINLYADPLDSGALVNLTSQGAGVHTVTKWIKGIEAAHLDDLANALTVGETYVQSGAFDHLFKISDGHFFTLATYGRVTYPRYERNGALQCNKNEEFLIIATSVRLLTRNASPTPFEFYTQESIRGIEQLRAEGMYLAQEGGTQ